MRADYLANQHTQACVTAGDLIIPSVADAEPTCMQPSRTLPEHALSLDL